MDRKLGEDLSYVHMVRDLRTCNCKEEIEGDVGLLYTHMGDEHLLAVQGPPFFLFLTNWMGVLPFCR